MFIIPFLTGAEQQKKGVIAQQRPDALQPIVKFILEFYKVQTAEGKKQIISALLFCILLIVTMFSILVCSIYLLVHS